MYFIERCLLNTITDVNIRTELSDRLLLTPSHNECMYCT